MRNSLLGEYHKGTLSMLQVERNLLLFIIAGTDTTAQTLLGLLLNIICSGKHITLLQQPTPEAFNTYLDACIEETLRFSPAVPDILPRFISAGGLAVPDTNLVLPEGTEAYSSAYGVSRDPRVFGDDADEFVPERWLSVGEQRTAEMRAAIMVFGYGTRICLGKQLAEEEIKLAARKVCSPPCISPVEVGGGRR